MMDSTTRTPVGSMNSCNSRTVVPGLATPKKGKQSTSQNLSGSAQGGSEEFNSTDLSTRRKLAEDAINHIEFLTIGFEHEFFRKDAHYRACFKRRYGADLTQSAIVDRIFLYNEQIKSNGFHISKNGLVPNEERGKVDFAKLKRNAKAKRDKQRDSTVIRESTTACGSDDNSTGVDLLSTDNPLVCNTLVEIEGQQAPLRENVDLQRYCPILDKNDCGVCKGPAPYWDRYQAHIDASVSKARFVAGTSAQSKQVAGESQPTLEERFNLLKDSVALSDDDILSYRAELCLPIGADSREVISVCQKLCDRFAIYHSETYKAMLVSNEVCKSHFPVEFSDATSYDVLVRAETIVTEIHPLGNCPACDHMRYLMKILFDRVERIHDVPLRDADWVSKNICREQVHEEGTCKCFRFVDWLCSGSHPSGTGCCTPNFLDNARVIVSAAALVFSKKQIMNNRSRKAAIADIRGNPYIIYCTRMFDSAIAPLRGNEEFFRNLYTVRVGVGRNGCYGYSADVLCGQVGEDVLCNPPGLVGWVKSVGSVVCKASDTLASVIRGTIEKLFSFFSDLADMVTSYFRDAIRKLVSRLLRWLADIFIDEAMLDPERREKYLAKVVRCSILIGVVILVSASFIGSTIGWTVIRMVSSLKEDLLSDHDLVGQGPIETGSLVVAAVAGAIGLKMSHQKVLKDKITFFTTLMVGSTVAMSAIATLLCLLPFGFRLALAYKFGLSGYVTQFEFSEWKTQASAVLACKAVPAIAGSDEFAEKIMNAVKYGHLLYPKLNNQQKREYSIVSLQLLKQTVNIQQQQYSQGTREYPFCFHVSGPPGIGKSLIINNLLHRACGMRSKDIFLRSNSDEFWSGYIAQDVIFYDEFLTNKALERDSIIANEYLELVSTQPFKVPMASVDNVIIGIKGSTAGPKVVVSANNTAYNRPKDCNVEAFQRRRRFVIEFAKSDLYKGGKNEVDMRAYSSEQRQSVSWAKFRLATGYFDAQKGGTIDNMATTGWMSFDALCEAIRIMYVDHQELAKELASEFGGDQASRVEPLNVMKETVANLYGFPSKPMSVTDALFDMMGYQSESSKESCTHVCCGVTKTHRKQGVDSTFTCMKCKKLYDCGKSVFSLVPIASNHDEVIEGCVDNILDIQWNGSSFVLPTKDQLEASLTTRTVAFYVGIGCALVAIAYGLKRLLSRSKEVDEVTFTGQSRGPEKVSNQRVRRLPKFRGAHLKGQNNDRGFGACTMRVELADGRSRDIRVIPIKGRWILTYLHSLRDSESPTGFIPRQTNLTLFTNGQAYYDEFELENWQICEEFDIALHEWYDWRLPQRKSIIKKFISEDELDKIDGQRALLECADVDREVTVKMYRNVAYVTKGFRDELPQAWKYSSATKNGDCGSPLVLQHGGFHGICIGMHVAGNGDISSRPQGVATPITREMLEAVLEPRVEDHYSGQGLADDMEELAKLPNCKKIELAGQRDTVHMPQVSKIKKSILHGKLPVDPPKVEPILSQKDPRANGKDPIMNSLKEALSFEQPEVDEETVDAIFDTMFRIHSSKLNWKAGKRQLTFEEACKGIPGILASIKIKSSPGWPLVKEAIRPGKKDFIWFDEKGEFMYNPRFRKLVEERVQEMDAYEGGPIDHRFLGFLKDETITASKAQQVRIRMIFANNLISLVAFRMKYGAIFAAYNNSAEFLPPAIGINQYSHDLELIYRRLAEIGKNLFDGDFKGFDKHMVLYFRAAAFKLLMKLAKLCGVSDNANSYMYEHETNCPLQVQHFLIWVLSLNFSGGFWTTILNCLVNEGYFRYIWRKVYPDKKFDDNVALSVLGDDNIGSVKDGNPLFTPAEIGKLMKRYLNQEYTAADKDSELSERYKSFEECTFLGAHPRKVAGTYSGAIRKETLWNSVCWTKDNNLSLSQTVKQLVELSSQWDEEFFNFYVDSLKKGLEDQDVISACLPLEGYKELQQIVSARTAESGATFYGFIGESPEYTRVDQLKELQFRRGLLQLNAVQPLLVAARFLSHGRNPFSLIHRMVGDEDLPSYYAQDGPVISESTRKDAFRRLFYDRWGVHFDQALQSMDDCEMGDIMHWTKLYYLCEHATCCFDKALSKFDDDDHWKCPRLGEDLVGDISSHVVPALYLAGSYGNQRMAHNGNQALEKIERLGVRMVGTSPGTDLVGQGPEPDGLTVMKASKDTEASNVKQIGTFTNLASLAINEQQGDLHLGTRSIVLRDSITWSPSDATNTILKQYDVPWGLLSLGNTNNLQNMPFQNYIYYTTDVQVTIRIIGNRFCQGMIAAYFTRLNASDVAWSRHMLTTMEHIRLSPESSPVGVLDLPWCYMRAAGNTFAGGQGDESLGKLKIQVFSPLFNPDSQSIPIMINVTFPNARFATPRPPIPASRDLARGGNPHVKEDTDLVGQGSSFSKNVINNNYDVHDVVGNVAPQTTASPSTSQSSKLDSDIKADVPMDNPMLVGGAIPFYPQLPNLSKSCGIDSTVGMQYHPERMEREQFQFCSGETKLEWIMGKECFHDSFTWTTSDAVGKVMYTMNLNSVLSGASGKSIYTPSQFAFNVMLLNRFKFWRADFTFKLVCVKNFMQVGSQRFTVGLGAPPPIASADRMIYRNEVFNFDANNAIGEVTIPFVAATEFLRTFEGNEMYDMVQNYSLGTVIITVENTLQIASPGTVHDGVEVLIFVKLSNVRVAVSNPIDPLFLSHGYFDAVPYIGVVPTPALTNIENDFEMEEYVGQGADDDIDVEEGLAPDDHENTKKTPLIVSESDLMANRMCKIELGRNKEYVITDVHEVCRRYLQVTPAAVPDSENSGYQILYYDVRPYDHWGDLYGGWKGHINMRLEILNQALATGTATMGGYVKYIPLLSQGAYNLPGTAATTINSLSLGGFIMNPDEQGLAGYTLGLTASTKVYNHGKPFMMPTEQAFPLTPGISVLNITIPFDSHFLFAKMHEDYVVKEKTWQSNIGVIMMRVPKTTQVEVFQSIGDDFRYFIWRPPPTVEFQVAGVVAPTANGAIGGLYGYRQTTTQTVATTTTTLTFTTSSRGDASKSTCITTNSATHARMSVGPVAKDRISDSSSPVKSSPSGNWLI